MKTVGVLRGGPGTDDLLSLLSGERFLTALSPHFRTIDIVINKHRQWSGNNKIDSCDNILARCDLVINTASDIYGEDGQVQQILRQNKKDFFGSESLASKLAHHKTLAKEIYQRNGLKTPRWHRVKATDNLPQVAKAIFNSFMFPVIIKPNNGTLSAGISIANSLAELNKNLTKVFRLSDEAIVEEFIKGREFSCVVLENFRNQDYYVFPPIEIKHKDYTHHSFHDKITGRKLSQKIAKLSQLEKELLKQEAISAHRALGARHYSCSDFILHPKRGLFILETNTNPKWLKDSVLDTALQMVGIKDENFVKHIVAISSKK